MDPTFALEDSDGQPIVGWTVLDGPTDVGSEQRWLLRLADGQRAVLGQLSPELARDESVRRRWVRDVERLLACAASSVAPVLATGPRPTGSSSSDQPKRVAPWRLRIEPEGEPVTEWLARAPVPIDELARRGAGLADALHAVHLSGAVVRNLHPRDLIWTYDGRMVLTDVGLARVDLLSSHTASSLLITGSAYAAPEQLLHTIVDQRADLYSIGVILWQAATGSLPFGDGPALLRERVELPPIHALRRDAPPILDVLLRRLLGERPEDRPASAAELAWVLRGGAGDGLVVAGSTTCQHCGTTLRLGQRLCLACGRVAVRFEHQPTTVREQWGVELSSLSEDAEALTRFHEFIRSVAPSSTRPDEFVIGDVSLYSEQELVDRKRLPARLFDHLDRATSAELVGRMKELGLDVTVVRPDHSKRWSAATVAIGVATFATIAALVELGVTGAPLALVVILGAMLATFTGVRASTAIADRRVRPLYRLRAAPAALPASDPLVARLAALLHETSEGPTPADVRAQLGELALLIQRLVDRRAELMGLTEAAELEMLTGPVEPLVTELERWVHELARCDRELAELDEPSLVRALGAVEARNRDLEIRTRERERLLDALDRLRTLEDRRMTGFHRLLETSMLLGRAVDLGLGVHDPAAEHDRQIKLALASLQPL